MTWIFYRLAASGGFLAFACTKVGGAWPLVITIAAAGGIFVHAALDWRDR